MVDTGRYVVVVLSHGSDPSELRQSSARRLLCGEHGRDRHAIEAGNETAVNAKDAQLFAGAGYELGRAIKVHGMIGYLNHIDSPLGCGAAKRHDHFNKGSYRHCQASIAK